MINRGPVINLLAIMLTSSFLRRLTPYLAQSLTVMLAVIDFAHRHDLLRGIKKAVTNW